MTAIDAKTFAERFEDLGDYLSTDEIQELLRELPEKTLTDGDVLLREGSPSSSVYLLCDGSLRVLVGEGAEEIQVGRIAQGALVGEISFLDDGPASATVRAVGPTMLLELSRDRLDALRTTHPRIATALLRALCKSLAARVRGAGVALDRLHGVEPAQHRSGFIDGLRALFGLAKD